MTMGSVVADGAPSLPVAGGAPHVPVDGRAAVRLATVRRAAGLVAAVAVLVAVALVSIAVGAKSIPLGTVVHVLVHDEHSYDGLVVLDLRLPRTVLGVGVGAALGLAGALMQALTRNPLADPGVLGVNAGASAAVVMAMWVWGFTDLDAYVWFAFVGAGVASVVVYALGSRGRGGATPVRLALAGTAVSAALGALISAVTLVEPNVFDQFRFWSVGSLSGTSMSVLWQVLPFLAIGALLALGLARSLNALALGDDAGRALGAHPGWTRALGALSVTLLCGAATAAVGPIGFIGLTVPHMARAVTGPDQRWVLPYSMVLGAIVLLGSDIVGRVVAPPGEVQVGIVTAFVGAPVLIALVRRRKVVRL